MAEPSGAPCVVVAAGGTGGHLFPAEALTIALKARGVVVDLITDERATRYGDFPGRATHTVPSATFAGRDPFSVLRTTLRLTRGFKQALGLLGRLRPAAVIGFGGYPTIPPVLAAWLRRIPTIIHEQNGVPGRANRFLAPRVRAIATGFPGVFNDDARLAAKTTHTGNPIRPAVIEAAAAPYPDATGPPAHSRIRRQPGRAHHGGHRAAGDRARAARGAGAADHHAAGPRGRPRAGTLRLCAHGRCRRRRTVLPRPAAPDGGKPPRDLALRRLDRR